MKAVIFYKVSEHSRNHQIKSLLKDYVWKTKLFKKSNKGFKVNLCILEVKTTHILFLYTHG